MTTKISLDNLTDSDYKALLHNDKVVNSLIEYTTESTSLMLDDWFNLLDGVGDYSLSDSSQYNYMYISNSYKFLGSVLTAQEDYRLLTDAMAEKIKQVLSDYEDSDLDSSYEDTLDMVGEQVADVLVNVAKDEYDDALSDERLLEAMKDYETLLFIYGEDAYYNRDDNKIYHMVAD